MTSLSIEGLTPRSARQIAQGPIDSLAVQFGGEPDAFPGAFPLDSLVWAVYSLRTVELPAYAVEGIHCDANAVVAPLCVLNGGTIIPPCAETCKSFEAVRSLYVKCRSRSGAAAMKLEDFVPAKVVNVGSHTVRR